jgi:hypothetical protein
VNAGTTYGTLTADIAQVVLSIVQLLRDNCNKSPDDVMKEYCGPKKRIGAFERLTIHRLVREKIHSRAHRARVEDCLYCALIKLTLQDIQRMFDETPKSEQAEQTKKAAAPKPKKETSTKEY